MRITQSLMPNETSQIPNPLKCWFTLFLQGNFLVNLHTFWRTNFRATKWAGVQFFFTNIGYLKPGSVSPLPELCFNCNLQSVSQS